MPPPGSTADIGASFFGSPATIASAAGAICNSGGTSLDNVTRAHHFVNDLNAIYPALRFEAEPDEKASPA
jgi:hypothetical protein